MHEDRWGLPITAQTPRAVDSYSEAVAQLLEHRLAAADCLKTALAAEPQFFMGLCLRGTMLMQLATHAVYPKVDETIAAAEAVSGDATPRERDHLAALSHWRQGRIAAACRQWRSIAEAHPRDVLALRLHHFMSFWRGDRRALRDLPASVLAAVESDLPGYGFVVGMHGFGLEECGDYGAAEAASREAVERNPEDLWAIHAVAHVMEMQGRSKEGADWLDYPAGRWSDRNPFKDHVWWHAALFAFELGDHQRVLELYDREIRVDESGFYLDVQNAASLLMRLVLCGLDVGDRWQPLADLAEKRIGDHIMAFTDLHYMMSLVAAGRLEAAGRYLASLRDFAEAGGSDAAEIATRLSLPIATALLAYGERDYKATVEILHPLRGRMADIGGSHAQQDIFQQILIDAAIRGRCVKEAGALLRDRAARRPDCPATRAFLAALGSY